MQWTMGSVIEMESQGSVNVHWGLLTVRVVAMECSQLHKKA